MEPGQVSPPPHWPRLRGRWSSRLLLAAPAFAAALLGGAGLRQGWFDTQPAGLLLLVIETSLLTVALLGGYLQAHAWITETTRIIAELERDLRHLLPWDSEEGLLRKTGLIRDLNALGAAPRELGHAQLRGADLTGCNLRGASLRGADLRQANLQGALLDGADLSDADLAEANLAMASLAGISARGANLEGAALMKANLAGANLSRANLVNANLHGTDLRSVTLERARFAEPGSGAFGQTPHASVDDWIRERLDARGYYVAGAPPGDSAPRTKQAEAG